jgi:hypothetical protein
LDEKVNIPLNQFQAWMQQLLLDPFQQTDIDPRNLLPDSFKEGTLEDVIHHSKKLSAKDHLAIYQRSYIARLRHCMAQQFSALEYALGEDIFCALADDYLSERPSHHYNLGLLGQEFAEHLQATRPDKEQKEDWVDFMIELAQFEYALSGIFEEKAEENYQLAEIETTDGELKLVPICALFKFQFPIRWFYTEFKNGSEPELPFERESYCMVLRHNYKLGVYDLHKEQYEFLTLLKNGADIKNAKLTFKQNRNINDESFDKVWPNWKARWIKVGVFRI